MTAPLSISSRSMLGIGVAAADEAGELVDVDGVVGQVGRQQDRRFPQDLAADHHEPARQRGAQSRCRCTRANIRCEVDEPMSMPTVVSSTLSAAHATSLSGSSAVPTWRCSNSRSCMRRRGRGRVWRQAASLTNFRHARLHAVLRELRQIDLVDARILVLVFDLAAAVLDAHVHAHEHVALVGGERIAQAAEGDREIARGIGRRVEVLVEHLVGRREHHAVLPVDALEVLLALVPEQRIAVAGDREDVEIGAVAMGLLVGADRHLRGVRVHGAVGQDEHHVRAAGAALGPRS